MMRRLVQLVVVLLAASCANSAPTVVHFENSYRQPESLEALATQVRAMGGLVFVGSPDGSSSHHDPSVAPAPNLADIYMSQPLESAGVYVSDGLGDTAASQMTLLATAGPMTLVDASGQHAGQYVLETEEDLVELHSMPSAGNWVFFVIYEDDDALMYSRARLLDDGTVDASATNAGGTVALTALRTGI